MDKATSSLTSKKHALGRVLTFCSAGGQLLRLSNTKLVYTVADNTHESMATTLPDETGILPDIYVTQSIDDYLNNIDAVKESVLKLIEKSER